MKYDLEALVEMFFRRRSVFFRSAGWALVSTMVMLMLCPPFYTSQAEILVQQDRAQLLVSPTLQAGQDNQSTVVDRPPEEQDLNSELELLTNQYLVEEALAGLSPVKTRLERAFGWLGSLANFPNYLYGLMHGTPAPSARRQWAEEILRHLKCEVLKRTNVIELNFTSHDPRWSHDFLVGLIDHYLELRAAISHDPQAEQFFNQQAALLKAKLARSEDNLRALQIQTGIADLPDQEKALVDQLNGFRSAYGNNNSTLAGTNRRIAYLTRQLGSYPRQVNAETKVVQNIALQTLKPQVLQLEAERAELLTRYQPDSERIQEINAKLNAASTLLNREDTRQVADVSTTINPTWQTLSTDLAEAKASAATLQASQSELAQQIADSEARLARLTNAGLEIERLERKVETDQEAYLSYVRKGEEARAANALNLSKILNASVSSPPSLPEEPFFPSFPVDLYVGLLTALICGMFFVYRSEDPLLCSPQAVAQTAGVSTVVVLRSTE